MPESEAFKIISNGGSFGLLAIIVVWIIYYGAPMIRDTIKSLGEAQNTVINKITEALDRSDARITEAMEHSAVHHRATIETLTKECREERRDLVAKLMNGDRP